MTEDVTPESAAGEQNLKCGLIMPISAIDNCSEQHWADVKDIIVEAIQSIEKPKFTVSLVSDADDAGVIQRRIVQNVYNSDIVVCDVSGKNPNVMFELGLRIAFDKPVVIVKDDKTNYSFDTAPIEHVLYPRDLRFNRIVEFKSALAAKVVGTYNAAQSEHGASFLKNFGEFRVATLDQKAVPFEKFIVGSISELQDQVNSLFQEVRRANKQVRHPVASISARPHPPVTPLTLKDSDRLFSISLRKAIDEYSANYNRGYEELLLSPDAPFNDMVQSIGAEHGIDVKNSLKIADEILEKLAYGDKS
jgi:hypothetical protein